MPGPATTRILSELQPMFEEALDKPGVVITLQSNAKNTPGWDSLAHIDIIEMIERHFKIKFALGELQDLKDVADLVTLIERKCERS